MPFLCVSECMFVGLHTAYMSVMAVIFMCLSESNSEKMCVVMGVFLWYLEPKVTDLTSTADKLI